MNHEAKTLKEHLESTNIVVATITPKGGCDKIFVKGAEKFDFSVNPNFSDVIIRNMVRNMLSSEYKKSPIIIERPTVIA